jgi:hypothetical protein
MRKIQLWKYARAENLYASRRLPIDVQQDLELALRGDTKNLINGAMFHALVTWRKHLHA